MHLSPAPPARSRNFPLRWLALQKTLNLKKEGPSAQGVGLHRLKQETPKVLKRLAKRMNIRDFSLCLENLLSAGQFHSFKAVLQFGRGQ
ncbi:unnamed protein product [Calypogeia fissa]